MNDVYLPLHPDGFRDIAVDDLERFFVEPFGNVGKKRAELCKKFKKWLFEVKSIGVPLIIWVDGSFVTQKPAPEDIDVVCIMDSNNLRNLSLEYKNRLSELFKTRDIKLKYGCHVFPVINGDSKQYAYWIRHFGYGRDRSPKGIFRIFLGGSN